MPNKRRFVRLGRILGDGASAGPRVRFGPGLEIVVVPNGRSAFLYFEEGVEREKVVTNVLSRRGVDLAAWREDGWGAVRRLGRELRFRPMPPAGNGPRDAAGRTWELFGDPRALELEISDGIVRYGEYPDALERLWGCLRSPRCGDVVLSATPGYTFGEVSGNFHEQSDHGSLHASDSNVFVLASDVPAPRRLTDVVPTLLDHFGTAAAAAGGGHWDVRLERRRHRGDGARCPVGTPAETPDAPNARRRMRSVARCSLNTGGLSVA